MTVFLDLCNSRPQGALHRVRDRLRVHAHARLPLALHFADVLQHSVAAALIMPEDVDRGIRDCLRVGKRHNADAIAVK